MRERVDHLGVLQAHFVVLTLPSSVEAAREIDHHLRRQLNCGEGDTPDTERTVARNSLADVLPTVEAIAQGESRPVLNGEAATSA